MTRHKIFSLKKQHKMHKKNPVILFDEVNEQSCFCLHQIRLHFVYYVHNKGFMYLF